MATAVHQQFDINMLYEKINNINIIKINGCYFTFLGIIPSSILSWVEYLDYPFIISKKDTLLLTSYYIEYISKLYNSY